MAAERADGQVVSRCSSNNECVPRYGASLAVGRFSPHVACGDTQNIGGDPTDVVFHRYTRPRLEVEPHGKHGRSRLVNMRAVADKLMIGGEYIGRPRAHPSVPIGMRVHAILCSARTQFLPALSHFSDARCGTHFALDSQVFLFAAWRSRESRRTHGGGGNS